MTYRKDDWDYEYSKTKNETNYFENSYIDSKEKIKRLLFILEERMEKEAKSLMEENIVNVSIIDLNLTLKLVENLERDNKLLNLLLERNYLREGYVDHKIHYIFEELEKIPQLEGIEERVNKRFKKMDKKGDKLLKEFKKVRKIKEKNDKKIIEDSERRLKEMEHIGQYR